MPRPQFVICTTGPIIFSLARGRIALVVRGLLAGVVAWSRLRSFDRGRPPAPKRTARHVGAARKRPPKHKAVWTAGAPTAFGSAFGLRMTLSAPLSGR